MTSIKQHTILIRRHSPFTNKENGKTVPVYRTVLSPVTLEIWDRHLAGSYPLVAALACDDGTAHVFSFSPLI
jgi:hypothetical protein